MKNWLTLQNNATNRCRNCSRKSNWNFIDDFYQREKNARKQIEKFQFHVVELITTFQHVDLNAQQNRIIFNKLHAHFDELQIVYNIVESIRIRYENDFHDERQKHKTCKKVFEQKRRHHIETKRNLNCVWNVHNRLKKIIFKMSYEIVDETTHKSFLNINDLIFELKAKTFKISSFEFSLTQIQSNIEKIQIKQNIDVVRHAKKKIDLIEQLQSIFHREFSMSHTLNSIKKNVKKSNWRKRFREKRKSQIDVCLSIMNDEKNENFKIENYIKIENI